MHFLACFTKISWQDFGYFPACGPGPRHFLFPGNGTSGITTTFLFGAFATTGFVVGFGVDLVVGCFVVGILVVTGAGVVVDCFVVGRLFLRFFVSNSDFSEIENLADSYNLIC